MGTEILKSFGTLQSELEQAKNSLKGVDENIKRLIGRDPSELPPRANIKRNTAPNDDRGGNNRQRPVRNRNFNHENDEPPNKRRNSGVSVFKRLSERPMHYDDDGHQPQKQMISKVIVTPKELPSRQEALAAQSKDEQSKARNRRMFGALLGTLQKFQQEETKLKQKEEKRAQLEKKIEEHENKEKEEIKKERQELFYNRKKKQAEIKMIELKMMRMKEYAAWEERQKPRMHFIQTKAKPHIHYLPRKMNDASKALLETCRTEIEKMIDKKRQEVYDELQHIEDRMKRNFEGKKSKDGKEDIDQDEMNDDHEHDHDHSGNYDEDGDNIMLDLDSKNKEPVESKSKEEEENVENQSEEPNVEQQTNNGNNEENDKMEENHKNNSEESSTVEQTEVQETEEECKTPTWENPEEKSEYNTNVDEKLEKDNEADVQNEKSECV